MLTQYFDQAVGFVKTNQRQVIKIGMTVVGAVLGALASGVVNGMLEDDFEAASMEEVNAAVEETIPA